MALARWQTQKPIKWKTVPQWTFLEDPKKPYMFIFFGADGRYVNHYPNEALIVDHTSTERHAGGVFQYCYDSCHPRGGYHYKEPSEGRLDARGQGGRKAPKLTFKAGLYRDGSGLGNANSDAKGQRRSKVRR